MKTAFYYFLNEKQKGALVLLDKCQVLVNDKKKDIFRKKKLHKGHSLVKVHRLIKWAEKNLNQKIKTVLPSILTYASTISMSPSKAGESVAWIWDIRGQQKHDNCRWHPTHSGNTKIKALVAAPLESGNEKPDGLQPTFYRLL